MKYAHFYKFGKKSILTINDSTRPIGGLNLAVANKAEARKLAKSHDAKCWNF